MVLGPLFEAYGPRYLEGAAHGISVIKEMVFEEQGPPLVVEPQPTVEQEIPVEPKIPAKKGSYDAIRDQLETIKSKDPDKTKTP